MRRIRVKTVPGGAEQGWPRCQADPSCSLGRWASFHTPGIRIFLKATVSKIRLWMLYPEVWPVGRLEKSPALSGRISLEKAPQGDLEIPNKLREKGWGSWNRQQFSKVTNMGTNLPGTAIVVCPWNLGKVRKSGVGGSEFHSHRENEQYLQGLDALKLIREKSLRKEHTGANRHLNAFHRNLY